MTVFITVILGLILVILGLWSAWPPWAWLATTAVLPAIAVAINKVLTRESDEFPSELTLEPHVPVPPAQRQEQRVTSISLPSSAADYDFSFSATVRWTLMESEDDAPLINPAGLAVDAVLQRARTVAADQLPTRSALLQHQLDAALGVMRPDPTHRVSAMARDVSLVLPDPDRERLARLSSVRKDEDLWEHERNYERNKRAYLGDDVLKDTGSAVVWWLSKNDDQVEGAVDRIGLLASLSAAANNDSVVPTFQHLVPPAPFEPRARQAADEPAATRDQRTDATGTFEPSWSPAPDASVDSLLEWLGFGLDDTDVALFSERLAQIAQIHGKTQAAERIRARFDPPETDEPAEDPEPAE
ncbi:hypothetical protein [Streptomyces sp. JV176]|uniref:hypothetical protein n=1 Tax=Streptomyces sp. JV176 TaxID=858630 RepID=UPI002E7A50E6|nr:hypothetical protein [Streptomyces sp. JV176]